MANRYITFGSTDTTQDISKLVYADISMKSIPAKIHLKSIYNNAQSVGSLSADGADVPESSFNNQFDPDFSDDKTDYVFHSEVSSENGTAKINFYDSSMMPNTAAVEYNKEARKKSAFKLDKNVNVIAIKRAIHNIFHWTPGERILNPEFGSNLRKFLYEGITDYNKEQIMAEIRRCVTEWEPRARVDRVIDMSQVSDHEDNTVKLEIIYSIPSLTNEQFSYTYEQTAG